MSLKGVLIILSVWLLAACAQDAYEVSDGSALPVNELEGKWVFVNYWATWCKPCIKEIPELNALNLKDDIEVLGYNFDRLSGQALADAAAALNIQFVLLGRDPSALYGESLPSALPATMVIGPDGEFIKWLMGPQTTETFLEQIERI